MRTVKRQQSYDMHLTASISIYLIQLSKLTVLVASGCCYNPQFMVVFLIKGALNKSGFSVITAYFQFKERPAVLQSIIKLFNPVYFLAVDFSYRFTYQYPQPVSRCTRNNGQHLYSPRILSEKWRLLLIGCPVFKIEILPTNDTGNNCCQCEPADKHASGRQQQDNQT